MNFYHLPILRVLLPFIAGTLVGGRISLPFLGYFIWGVFILTIISITIKAPYSKVISIICFGLFLGYSCIQMENHEQSPPNISGTFNGHIVVEKIVKQKVGLCTFQFQHDTHKYLAHLLKSEILIYPADTILVKSLKFKSLALQDSVFGDYNQYLAGQGIKGTCFIQRHQIQSIQKGYSILGKLYELRYFLSLKVQQSKVLSKNETGIFLSLLLGEKSFLTKELKFQYKQSGVIHVLAISGLHVGIFFFFIQFLCKMLFINNVKIQFVIISLLLISYACLSGLSPSVMRAVLMCILIQFSKVLSAKSISLNTVFSSAFFLLLFQPTLLFDIGFQLSYSAVIFIVHGHQELGGKWVASSKVGKYLWGFALINLLAFMGTCPILLFHFQEVYLSSLITGFFVIPMVSLLVIGGVITLSFVAFQQVFEWGLKFCKVPLYLVNGVAEFISTHLPLPLFYSISESESYVLLLTGLVCISQKPKLLTKLIIITFAVCYVCFSEYLWELARIS